MGAARAMLTREDSEWSRKFEEPWQSRPRDWRGVGQVFFQDRVKGLAKSLQRGRWRCSKGHFTHEPRAMTMRLWEPKRKCPKAVPRHFHNYVVWHGSSSVTRPSTKNAISMNFYSCGFSHMIE